MTAFARAEHIPGDVRILWEIRAVNHRYLDTRFKLPDQCRQLEPTLKARFKNKLARGRVECTLQLILPPADAALQVNTELVKQLWAALGKIGDLTAPGLSTDTLALMKYPGVLTQMQAREVSDADILACFDTAIDSLMQMRSREGRELAGMIETRLAEVSSIVKTLREAAPIIARKQQEKLRQHISELEAGLQGKTDPSRLELELVILAQKQDVMEELDRLDTHVAEVRKNLAQSEPVGRRLDFLMQELNREANTLSSKAVVTDTSLRAVDLKVIIEQMREQIQNIE